MNFLKITDETNCQGDKDHYINFDLVCRFFTEDWVSAAKSTAVYLITFVQDTKDISLKFKDKKRRDQMVTWISDFINVE